MTLKDFLSNTEKHQSVSLLILLFNKNLPTKCIAIIYCYLRLILTNRLMVIFVSLLYP